MAYYSNVILHPGREENALFGHPWIFSKAIAEAPQEPSIVRVLSHDGSFVGIASYNPKNSIALRLFTRLDERLDSHWFYQRFQKLLAYRDRFLSTPTYRLCFGESDGIPGLVVDRFGDIAVIQINTEGITLLLEPIKEALLRSGFVELFETASGQEGIQRPPIHQLIWAEENGFAIALKPGAQKTGWYCDQRENRALIEKLGCKRVLNLFSFSGGFALAALRGGADLVVNVDQNKEALVLFEEMKSKNSLCGAHENHAEDVWDYLKEEKRLFDLVICDPPAFVKQADKKQAALKGYKDIFQASIKRVEKGGFMALFSCSHYMQQEDLEFVLRGAYQGSNRFFQTVAFLDQPFDHPVPAYFPQARYIKGFLLKEL